MIFPQGWNLSVQNEICHLGFNTAACETKFSKGFLFPSFMNLKTQSNWIWAGSNSFYLLLWLLSLKKRFKLFGQFFVVDSIFSGMWTTLFVTGSRFITEKLPDTPTTPTKHSTESITKKPRVQSQVLESQELSATSTQPPGAAAAPASLTTWTHRISPQSHCLTHCTGRTLSVSRAATLCFVFSPLFIVWSHALFTSLTLLRRQNY